MNSSNTVNEGEYFNATCEASGDPEPTNYRVKHGQQYNGKVLAFKNIAQNDAGEYRSMRSRESMWEGQREPDCSCVL